MTEGTDQQRAQRLHGLRQRAAQLIEQGGAQVESVASVDALKLLEELRIAQVELEIQNEDLRNAQQRCEIASQRYQTLFWQMPIPALVVDLRGVVHEYNESARLLAKTRCDVALDRAPGKFARCFADDDQTRLHSGLRDARDASPLVLDRMRLEPIRKEIEPLVLDAHLVFLPLDYHLDPRILMLLVDRTSELARAHEKDFYQAMLNNSADMIYAADRDGLMLLANDALLRLLGRRREQVVGFSRENFLPVRDALAHREADKRVLGEGQPLSVEEQVHMPAPVGTLDFLTRKFPLCDAHGQLYGVGGISTDISELQRRDRMLRLSEAVFLNSNDAIILTDDETRIVRVNPAFIRQSGFSEDAVIGRKTSLLRSGRQDDGYYEAMWQRLRSSGEWSGEMVNRNVNGTYYTVWCSIRAIHDTHGHLTHYCATETDITQLRTAQSEVALLASYDNLTGLPNRYLFNDRLNLLLAYTRRRQARFALAFVDIDHFKEVNDSLGHQVGDELLKGIASRLQSGVRTEDTVARTGGDEFVLLLPATDRHQAEIVANNLLHVLHEPLQLSPVVSYQPTASIGVAVYPEDGEKIDELMRNADTAMYHAKAAGRNRVSTYTASMGERSAATFVLHTELAGALARAQMQVHFQPKVRLADGSIAGAEALLRWQRPGHGLVPPGDFIAVAERSGLLVELDQWVLSQAVRQVADWQRRGLWRSGMRMAVNQNGRDLCHPKLVALMHDLLQHHAVPPAYLEIEITEDVLLDHSDALMARLEELRALGVRLAIDDFGTGYSSLAYLKRLPISALKIDRGFVRDMMTRDGDRVLVETMLDLARRLGHEVVAEGIEDTEQLERLIELGCPFGQGYLFGRAVDGTEFSAKHLQTAKADATGVAR